VWLVDDKRVVISRDVVFNETVFYKTNPETQTSLQLDQRHESSPQV